VYVLAHTPTRHQENSQQMSHMHLTIDDRLRTALHHDET
jgi:hypothetical protein